MKRSIIFLMFLLLFVTCFAEQNPLYPIKIDGKWGFMNKSGEIAIEPAWSQVRDFSEGLAAVNCSDSWLDNWGFIDKSGKEVIPCQFYIASDNVLGMIWPQSTKNLNLRFGLNIIFGCYRKENIKECGCYWIQKEEERRERKQKLLNK